MASKKIKNKNCSICENKLKEKEVKIQCDICLNWLHQKCSLIFYDNHISSTEKEIITKHCPACVAAILPFHCSDDNELIIDNQNFNNTNELRLTPNDRLKELITDCNHLARNHDEMIDGDNQIEFPNTIDSSYHDLHQINQIRPDTNSSLGFLHTNLASIGKHFDDLSFVISQLKFNFHVIAISEHKIHTNDVNPTTNIEIEGYTSVNF